MAKKSIFFKCFAKFVWSGKVYFMRVIGRINGVVLKNRFCFVSFKNKNFEEPCFNGL
jgi:hypothetical protein